MSAPLHRHECSDCGALVDCEWEHPYEPGWSAPLGCDPPLRRETWHCDACAEGDARMAAEEMA